MPNFVVVIHGRGVLYTGMMSGDDVQEVANRCQSSVNQGFEVYLYTLEPSPLGANLQLPTGAMPLRRVYHLYDAKDRYIDEARSIIDGLSAHSEVASREYLKTMIDIFQQEFTVLQGGQHDKVVESTKASVQREETTQGAAQSGTAGN